ncbi:MAG: NAD(P)-dependent oxidoreductase [Alphaproteobacteria bacterium]|nr:NAD(P)-dependent oxidoreductase [Alphaproteobacteria bacterium]
MAPPARMLRFVDVAQHMPDKRKAAERRRDFGEIYAEFSAARAAEQASRCSQCGVPFCQVHCPLSNNIPDWLKLTAEGRLEEAYEVSAATNSFPEICGRICPQDRLCEGNCVIEKGFESVTIGAVERYITDTAWEKGWIKPIRPPHQRAQSVGIVGAGPGGLAAAEALRRKGYAVHVYDRYDRVGGLLIYGIPNFKLDKQIVERRAQWLADSGVVFHLNFEVGRDATLAEIRAQHDAVLVATGVYKARELQAPGAGLANIVPAMTYLTASNRKGLGDAVPDYDDGTLDAAGKHVVVIGGGDTAMDCVRTAVRQGAASVKCLYRRDRANMPGSLREVHHAEEEGVEFVWLSAPEAFIGRAAAPKGRRKGAVREAVGSVRSLRMRLGIADATGRQVPEPIAGSDFDLPADIVVKALGFDPDDLPAQFAAPDLATTKWGTLAIDRRSFMTSVDGVFAAGDIVRGASLVVWAIRDGRDAAAQIHRYIQAKAGAAAAEAAE